VVSTEDEAGNESVVPLLFAIEAVPPEPPTDFTGTATHTDRILWAWSDNSDNESGFWVYNADTNVPLHDEILLPDTNMFPEVGLTPNTPRRAFVKAVVDGGGEAVSNEITVHSLAAVPTEPAVVSASSEAITISWLGHNGSQYDVESSLSNDFSEILEEQTVTSEAATFQNLQDSTAYYFRVKAYNGDSLPTGWSETLSEETLATNTWIPRPTIAVGSYGAPAFVDIDYDGDEDLFMGSQSGRVMFYENLGTELSEDGLLLRDAYGIPIGEAEIHNYSIPSFVQNLRMSWAEPPSDPNVYDMLIGIERGVIRLCVNGGTIYTPAWQTLTSYIWGGINVDDDASPTFIDIDSDGYDELFVGNYLGILDFWDNDGIQLGKGRDVIDEDGGRVSAGGMYASPAFCDIDFDGDYDLFLGRSTGKIRFYENLDPTAEKTSPVWSANPNPEYADIDLDGRIRLAFADIDKDGDCDLFIGLRDGGLMFYENDLQRPPSR